MNVSHKILCAETLWKVLHYSSSKRLSWVILDKLRVDSLGQDEMTDLKNVDSQWGKILKISVVRQWRDKPRLGKNICKTHFW